MQKLNFWKKKREKKRVLTEAAVVNNRRETKAATHSNQMSLNMQRALWLFRETKEESPFLQFYTQIWNTKINI